MAREGGLDYRRGSLLRVRYHPMAEKGECLGGPLECSDDMLALLQPPVRAGFVPPVRYGRGIFVPFGASASTPNISIDAFENPGTVLTLSHWPSASTPERFWADLAATSVFRYIEARNTLPCDCVTSDHFDVDGLVGTATALEPIWALKNRSMLLKVAECGDFDIGHDPVARRGSLAINSWAADSFAKNARQKSHAEICAELFEELLFKLPDILMAVDKYEEAWRPEEEAFATTEKLSALPPEMFQRMLVDFLRVAPPA